MKLDPPPNMIRLVDTTRSVYHGKTLILTQSSEQSFMIPSFRVCEALCNLKTVRLWFLSATRQIWVRAEHLQTSEDQEHTYTIQSPCFDLELLIEARWCRHCIIKCCCIWKLVKSDSSRIGWKELWSSTKEQWSWNEDKDNRINTCYRDLPALPVSSRGRGCPGFHRSKSWIPLDVILSPCMMLRLGFPKEIKGFVS